MKSGRIALTVFCGAIAGGAWAQPVSRSFESSPDVYKQIAINAGYRVIEATWQPGQRDNWHSHGSPVGVYFLTDCNLRIHTPSGNVLDVMLKAGDARVGPQAPSHAAENVGRAVCKAILFEPI